MPDEKLRRELKLHSVLWKSYGMSRNACKELELPILSSQLHLSCIFILNKSQKFVGTEGSTCEKEIVLGISSATRWVEGIEY